MGIGDERTAAFYEWEIAGRGWAAHPYCVALGSSFLPFPGHGARRVVIDDAHRPSIFASLFGGARTPIPQSAPSRSERKPPESFIRDEAEEEFEILVPVDEKIELAASTAWLQSISVKQGPVAFELVGRDGKVSIRVAANARDIRRIRDHMRTMFRAWCSDELFGPPSIFGSTAMTGSSAGRNSRSFTSSCSHSTIQNAARTGIRMVTWGFKGRLPRTAAFKEFSMSACERRRL